MRLWQIPRWFYTREQDMLEFHSLKNPKLQENSININDNLPEQAFKSVFYLALGSNHSFDPNLFPYIVDYAKLFHCPDVVFEIERQLHDFSRRLIQKW